MALISRILASTVITLSLSIASVQAQSLDVVASFSILGDIAGEVGGGHVSVTTLVGPNGDAHVYEPRPADAAALAAADVVLVNGLGFEGFIDRLVKASGTKATIVAVSDGLTPLDMEAHEKHDHGDDHHHQGEEPHAHDDDHADHHHHGSSDPHAWQSVPNMRHYVEQIADAFCKADAVNCDHYRQNAAAYDGQLAALDSEIRAAVDAIPENKRRVITSHDAFRYLAHEYGLTFLAPKGVSTESEASAADVASLIRQAREEKASAIFVESISNPRLVEQIAAETGLTVGGQLYSDALSDADGPAPTYLDMMRHNIGAITKAVAGR